MNANAKKWVEALRSGEFSQTQGKLSDGESYCCLGVACEVYRRETGEGEWTRHDIQSGSDFREPFYAFMGIWNVLPESVINWLGLRDETGEWLEEPDRVVVSALTTENDSGKSFEEIADIIDNEPEGLFQ